MRPVSRRKVAANRKAPPSPPSRPKSRKRADVEEQKMVIEVEEPVFLSEGEAEEPCCCNSANFTCKVSVVSDMLDEDRQLIVERSGFGDLFKPKNMKLSRQFSYWLMSRVDGERSLFEAGDVRHPWVPQDSVKPYEISIANEDSGGKQNNVDKASSLDERLGKLDDKIVMGDKQIIGAGVAGVAAAEGNFEATGEAHMNQEVGDVDFSAVFGVFCTGDNGGLEDDFSTSNGGGVQDEDVQKNSEGGQSKRDHSVGIRPRKTSAKGLQ
uniref:Uncharacterized protein n=1 Tax=Chenopodium quinoa TaxID=63459 RepID=A0A803LS39_CHEQI